MNAHQRRKAVRAGTLIRVGTCLECFYVFEDRAWVLNCPHCNWPLRPRLPSMSWMSWTIEAHHNRP